MDTVLMSNIVPLSSNNLTPTFNHGCLFSEKLYTYGRNILLEVFHTQALISLRSLGAYPSDQGASYHQGLILCIYRVGTRNPPSSMGCPQGFIVPLWRLIPLPENHKEMMCVQCWNREGMWKVLINTSSCYPLLLFLFLTLYLFGCSGS